MENASDRMIRRNGVNMAVLRTGGRTIQTYSFLYGIIIVDLYRWMVLSGPIVLSSIFHHGRYMDIAMTNIPARFVISARGMETMFLLISTFSSIFPCPPYLSCFCLSCFISVFTLFGRSHGVRSGFWEIDLIVSIGLHA